MIDVDSAGIEEQNDSFDKILEGRRSIREFKPVLPPRELIEQIIRAGLLAPFAGEGGTVSLDRQFRVIPRDSHATVKLSGIMKRRAATASERLRQQMEQTPSSQQHGQFLVNRLKMMGDRGVPGVGSDPYYIVVGERKGAASDKSLSHCMQNMWLKATALGLGFHLLTITGTMAEDEDFCDLLGIPYGQYTLDGCGVGYPNSTPIPMERPQVADVTRWID
ncbi:MAG TPA: nitroreductase family protein [Terriglobales bacterium]|nr:nitroreductase family protein [Terriglobales bacterium]